MCVCVCVRLCFIWLLRYIFSPHFFEHNLFFALFWFLSKKYIWLVKNKKLENVLEKRAYVFSIYELRAAVFLSTSSSDCSVAIGSPSKKKKKNVAWTSLSEKTGFILIPCWVERYQFLSISKPCFPNLIQIYDCSNQKQWSFLDGFKTQKLHPKFFSRNKR